MTEQAGYLNAPDLVEECAEAIRAVDWSSFNTEEKALAVLSVLRKRGLLTIQALELLASSSIPKPINIPPIRK